MAAGLLCTAVCLALLLELLVGLCAGVYPSRIMPFNALGLLADGLAWLMAGIDWIAV